MKKLQEDRKRSFLVSNDTYRQDILFCFNMTGKEAVKALAKISKTIAEENKDYILGDQDHKRDSVDGTMYPLTRGYLVMLKWPKKNFRYNVCNAVHEIMHVTHYILRNVRIPLEENTEEAYTYLQQDILKKFLFKLY